MYLDPQLWLLQYIVARLTLKERHHLEFQSILESMKKREKEEKVERAKRQAEQRRLEDDMSAAATLW